MSAFTVTRPGQSNGAGSNLALFLEIFSGEVMTQFAKQNNIATLLLNRKIAHGKSADFPILGTTTASRHTPGAELLGNTIKQAEKSIAIDDLLVAHTSIANIDEAMNHYELRSKYATEMGVALADQNELEAICTIILAARTTTNTITGVGYAGERITNAAYATDADTLLAGLATCAQKFDEKRIPQRGRHAALKPSLWYLLTNDGSIYNRDYGNGNGSQQEASAVSWAGISLHKTLTVPSTVLAAVSGTNNTYNGDFLTTVAPVFHESVAGVLTLLGVSTESEYSVSRQSTLMVSKVANGKNWLRNDAAIEIATAAVA